MFQIQLILLMRIIRNNFIWKWIRGMGWTRHGKWNQRVLSKLHRCQHPSPRFKIPRRYSLHLLALRSSCRKCCIRPPSPPPPSTPSSSTSTPPTPAFTTSDTRRRCRLERGCRARNRNPTMCRKRSRKERRSVMKWLGERRGGCMGRWRRVWTNQR